MEKLTGKEKKYELNPRYVAYARAVHNTDPETAGDRDRERYPGGSNCGFMLWIQHHVQEFGRLHPDKVYTSICDGRHSIVDHVAFTDYLEGIPFTEKEIEFS